MHVTAMVALAVFVGYGLGRAHGSEAMAQLESELVSTLELLRLCECGES